jgi:hypothetical protein
MRNSTTLPPILLQPTDADLSIIKRPRILQLSHPIQSDLRSLIGTPIVHNQDFPLAVAKVCFIEVVDCFSEHDFDAGFFIIGRDDDGHDEFGRGRQGWERGGGGAGVGGCEGPFGGEGRTGRDVEELQDQEELKAIRASERGDTRGEWPLGPSQGGAKSPFGGKVPWS